MSVMQQLNSELADVVTGALPAIVEIHNGKRSGGAGTIWHADGLIVTNAHVVAPSVRRRRSPEVVLRDGRRLRARVLAWDKALDVAALSVKASDLPETVLGNSADVQPGDWVTAIGHPWGVRNAVTAGSVIAVGPPPEVRYAGDLIQVGLHMRPGHSGGALVDGDGRLIGINCMIAGPDVGLAVPVNAVKRFLRQKTV